jgi:hypothetical protein
MVDFSNTPEPENLLSTPMVDGSGFNNMTLEQLTETWKTNPASFTSGVLASKYNSPELTRWIWVHARYMEDKKIVWEVARRVCADEHVSPEILHEIMESELNTNPYIWLAISQNPAATKEILHDLWNKVSKFTNDVKGIASPYKAINDVDPETYMPILVNIKAHPNWVKTPEPQIIAKPKNKVSDVFGWVDDQEEEPEEVDFSKFFKDRNFTYFN